MNSHTDYLDRPLQIRRDDIPPCRMVVVIDGETGYEIDNTTVDCGVVLRGETVLCRPCRRRLAQGY